MELILLAVWAPGILYALWLIAKAVFHLNALADSAQQLDFSTDE
jgi:hypothetical protein